MKRLYFFIALAFVWINGISQIDTLTTTYTEPRIRFTELQTHKMIYVEEMKVKTSGNISISIFNAINMTDEDTFKCILLKIPKNSVNAGKTLYGYNSSFQDIEMTISEATGLLNTIKYANKNLVNKLSFVKRKLSYIGRYFLFELIWTPTETPPNSDFTADIAFRKTGISNRIIDYEILNFKIKDLKDLEGCLDQAIREYGKLK